jgi:hypothetical protein
MIDAVPVEASKEKIDEFSDTWIFVERWAKEELTKAREQNDSTKRTEVDTAALRGRISLLKQLLELPLPPKRERKRIDRPPVEEPEY